MDPEINSPRSAPGEREPHREAMPEIEPSSHERSVERNVPNPEQAGDGQELLRSVPQMPAVDPASVAVPQPTAPPAADAPAAPVPGDDLPVLAADEDLIEKEWVDRAKKVIADTKDDPSKREREVARLQADYLRKRYGKEIGDTNDA